MVRFLHSHGAFSVNIHVSLKKKMWEITLTFAEKLTFIGKVSDSGLTHTCFLVSI